MDTFIGVDMQKDEYVEKINTVTLDPKQANNVVKLKDIETTKLYDSNKNELVELNGYLDIGYYERLNRKFYWSNSL